MLADCLPNFAKHSKQYVICFFLRTQTKAVGKNEKNKNAGKQLTISCNFQHILLPAVSKRTDFGRGVCGGVARPYIDGIGGWKYARSHVDDWIFGNELYY